MSDGEDKDQLPQGEGEDYSSPQVDPTALLPEEGEADLTLPQPPDNDDTLPLDRIPSQIAAESDLEGSPLTLEEIEPPAEFQEETTLLSEEEGAERLPEAIEDLSAEELAEEEASFRAKYALDLEEEEDDDETGGYLEEILGEEETTELTPSAEQMDAIIKFLDDDGEEEEEEEDEEADDAEVDEEAGSVRKKEKETAEPSVLVLGPDHPKMIRFQAALRAHLERQNYEADCELRRLEGELKARKKTRTELGTNLYNLQHEMLRQTEAVEKIDKDMEKLLEKRIRMEDDARNVKESLHGFREQERQEQEREAGLRESVKTLDFTEHVVREAAEKYDGELKTRVLVDEKLARMRTRGEAEKRDQDFFLDRILSHVQHMELVNAGIRRQIDAHRDEQKQIQLYINEAVTEIDALQIEKLHLQRAWNETIAVVRSRDEALDAARTELKKVREDLRIHESELRSLSRLISREQESHEKSVILLRRRKVEERVLRSQLARLEDSNESLKVTLANLARVKKAVEIDLMRANNALHRKQKEILIPRRTLEALTHEKLRLEDKILNILHEQSGLNKAAQHIQNLIKVAREKTRNMENDVARVENENSLLAVEVERLRAELFRKTSHQSELDKRVAEQEKILQEQMKDILQSERVIQRKTGEVEKLNRKLEKLISQQGGAEVGPLEREIDDLERQLVAERDEVNRLQGEWLKRQDDLVRLTTQRDSVLLQNELLRKETFIMERKRQRLDGEVEKRRTEIAKARKATEGIRGEISAVNARLHVDKSAHEQMDKENILIQAELVAMLKEAEEEALELEGEVERLEVEKKTLLEGLEEAHATNLSWEKKVRLAKELRESLKKETEGSTNTLRLDIHHMQVRYNEIARAQEKLMSDLERSVDRRERIIQQADLNLKRDNVNPKHTKLNIQRNFAQIKERNRLLLKEAGEIEQQIRETMGTIKTLEDKLNETSNGLNKVREDISAFEVKIADASVQKHKNLIDLVLRQERYRILESMKLGRYRPSARTVEEVQQTLNDVEGQCFALIDLTDDLAREYPEAAVQVKLVKASIAPTLS